MIDFLGIPHLPPVASALWALCAFLKLLQWAIIARVLLWALLGKNKITEVLIKITEPAIHPFRPLTAKLLSGRFPFDLAPLCAYFAIGLIIFLLSPVVFRLTI